jgi:hypothetical protein
MSIEIGAGLGGRGCAVRFVARANSRKTPDAAIRLVDREVEVEFKALHDSADAAGWEALDDYLRGSLERLGLTTALFEMDLERTALTHPKAVLDGLLRVHFRRAREYISLPQSTGVARVSTLGNVGRTLRPGRPHIDIQRIRSKIAGWYRKFDDATGPTLFIVRTEDVYRRVADLDRPDQAALVADILLEKVQGLPRVSALLLYEEAFAGPPEPASASGPTFRATWGASAAGMSRSALLISNPRALVPLSDAERDVLLAEPSPW